MSTKREITDIDKHRSHTERGGVERSEFARVPFVFPSFVLSFNCCFLAVASFGKTS